MNSQNAASTIETLESASERKRKPRPVSLAENTPVAEAFGILAGSISAEAVRRARALRAKADPEVLHKLRVALRRMRSLYWAFEPLLDRKDYRAQREKFRYLAYAAGKTRDWDVLRDMLLAAISTHELTGSLLQAVDEQRAAALAFSRTTIRNAGIEEMLQSACVSAQQHLELFAPASTLAGLAGARVEVAEKALKKRIKRAIRSGHGDYAALHDVRIAGKRLRYLLEFFLPVLDSSHSEKIRRLSEVQEVLGKVNDLVVSETLLRQYSIQLGDSGVTEQAVAFLGARKIQYMNDAHAMLCNLK
jgi:CHAD domain-containing protein